MSTETSALPAAVIDAIDRFGVMGDSALLGEIEAVVESYGEAMPINLAILRHEARTRGIFIRDEDYDSIEDWMRDSDYLFCGGCDDEDFPNGCGWVDMVDNRVDPVGTYADAFQSMTWAEALDGLLGS